MAESCSEFKYSDALLLKDEAIVGGVWINDGMGPEMLIVEWLVELRLRTERPCGGMGSSSWNWDKKCQASAEPREWAASGCLANTGFHSVGSTSVESSPSPCILIDGGLVGVMGATIIGGEAGGVEAGDAKEDTEEPEDMEAERGLQESLRRQLQSMSMVSRTDGWKQHTFHCSTEESYPGL